MSTLCMTYINLTRDASAYLRIAEVVLFRDQNSLCLEEGCEHSRYLIDPSREISGTPYLNKVGRVSIIIDAAGIEARSSALSAQARNQTKRCDGRSAIRWGCREWDGEHARVALNGKDLSHYGENHHRMTLKRGAATLTHDELAPV